MVDVTAGDSVYLVWSVDSVFIGFAGESVYLCTFLRRKQLLEAGVDDEFAGVDEDMEIGGEGG